jgi:hypothetical protein
MMSIFGWTGLLISLLSLLALPFVLHRVESGVSDRIEAIADALRTTESVFSEQLILFDRIDETLMRVHDFSAATDESLASGTVLMDDMADFLGGPLDSTLEATEASLRSASEGAASIDALLRIITAVPFIGGPEYRPSQPLDASLLQAADGLAPLRPALSDLQADLRQFSGSTVKLQGEFLRMDTSLIKTGAQLAELRSELAQIGGTITEIAGRLDSLRAGLPALTWIFGLVAELVAIWTALINTLLLREAARMRKPVTAGVQG